MNQSAPEFTGDPEDNQASVHGQQQLSEPFSEEEVRPGSPDQVGSCDPGTSSLEDRTENSIFDLFESTVTEKVVLSKGDILLLILKYSKRHNLTLTGLVNLVELVNLMFSQPILPTSPYLLKKLLNQQGDTLKFNYYCPMCIIHVGEVEKKKQFNCPKCKKWWSVSEAPFFVMLDVVPQLQKVLAGCEFLDLTQPLPCTDELSDICDGAMYRDFVAATCDAGHRISFTLNADGTPLFKSSNTSIWPIQLIVNEVPAAERMKKLILAALWFGKDKPCMEMFQNIFVQDMNSLSTNGFLLKYKGYAEVFHAFCICCSVDAVARAPMQGVTQFNGYFGCNWCLQRGERVGKATKYPVVNECPDRTEEQMINDMEAAVQNKPVNGVKSVSPLINLEHFHIVWSFVPDYMHCVLLGVGKQFLELWLQPSAHAYYIGSEQQLDKKIQSVAPPKEVRRFPRPTRERRWWKAKEWENWILFYSLPVLEGILEKKYLDHWAHLVEAIQILVQEKISSSDLNVAEVYLVTFHGYAQHLYGKECMTFNMHQLLHLTKSVRHWGPLWAHSAFPFESGNGTLKQAVKAANGIPQQVCRVLQVDGLVNKLSEATTSIRVASYSATLGSGSRTLNSVAIRGEARFFGKGTPFLQPQCEIRNIHMLPESPVQYARMYRNGCIFTSSNYALGRRTNNSVVFLSNGSYGILRNILCCGESTFAVIQLLKCIPEKFGALISRHVLRVVRHESVLTLLPITQIEKTCVFVDLGSTYVSAVPRSLNL
ncbi:uncharacterized protein LOC144132521 [Amblyomma americanum]